MPWYIVDPQNRVQILKGILVLLQTEYISQMW